MKFVPKGAGIEPLFVALGTKGLRKS